MGPVTICAPTAGAIRGGAPVRGAPMRPSHPSGAMSVPGGRPASRGAASRRSRGGLNVLAAVKVNFEVTCPGELGPGEYVAVSGFALGQWRPEEAVRLSPRSGQPSVWEGEAGLDAGHRHDYKYLILKEGDTSQADWMPGDNMVIDIPREPEAVGWTAREGVAGVAFDITIRTSDVWPVESPAPAPAPAVPQHAPAPQEFAPQHHHIAEPVAASNGAASMPPPIAPPPPVIPPSDSFFPPSDSFFPPSDSFFPSASPTVPDFPPSPAASAPPPMPSGGDAEPYSPPPGGVDANGVPEWYRMSAFYHIQTLGFFGVETRAGEGMDNDGTGPKEHRLSSLTDWLDHLELLNVTGVYFGPLMESSSHGYDTADYMQIDRRLGDVEEFKKVVRCLQARGIRVLVDGVFNHTGPRFFAFENMIREGAHSEWAQWFRVGEGRGSHTINGVSFGCWEGHHTLPLLNHNHGPVRQYLFDVAKFWLGEVGIDGFRLDVAHEVDPGFWREYREVCNQINPMAVLVGETIHGDYNTWVGPGLLHSGTNYQTSKAIWSSLNDKNYFELVHCINREKDMYHDLPLMNFVGNHDVARIKNKLNVPDHYALATGFLYAYDGVPSIYYGDETGMDGEPGGPDGDLAMRRPLEYRKEGDNEWRYNVTALMGAVRRAHPVLAYGRVQVLGNTNAQMALGRISDDASMVVLFNCADELFHWEVDVGAAIGDGRLREILGVGRWEGGEQGARIIEHSYEVHGGRLSIDLPASSVLFLSSR